jgi:alpha-D-ribose 1-methylphosphonate 5-triphosphate synthase subunit PhnG
MMKEKMNTHYTDTPALAERKHWMGVLAKSLNQELEQAWEKLEPKPEFTFLREPEMGLVMVRARAGNTGQRFHLGEMAMTRCVVMLRNGIAGHSFVAGRCPRKSELAAIFDALLQDPIRHDEIADSLIQTLVRTQAERKAKKLSESGATKVEFFTMIRGEDE